MPEPVVVVKDLHKEFLLPQHKYTSLKERLVHYGKKNVNKHQRVLDGINFEVNKGDFFGIVGRNGSGKSTLLKILAGVYTPSGGEVQINGTLTPFIELGVGFNPELTGRDNVFLNGALLGFSRKEMESMYDEIVEFAELKEFMDQKLKNYSSGMQVRLAFSIAIKAHNDILIFDEVLAVGDEAFARKCSDYFTRIKKDKNQTVILVTHSMEAVRRYCNKAVLLEDGKITNTGTPDEVADAYSMQFVNTDTKTSTPDRYGSGQVMYKNIKHTLTKEKLVLDFDIVNMADTDQEGITMGFDFFVDGEPIFGTDTRYIKNYEKGVRLQAKAKRHFKVAFDNNFGSNTFDVNMTIAIGLGIEYTDRLHPAFSFDSVNVGYYSGFRILGFPSVKDSAVK